MLEHIIRLSLQNRAVVISASVILVFVGAAALQRLPIDAFPDTTPVQVQVNATAPGYPPEEVESLITFPIEQVLAGLPKLHEVRSISKYSLSQVTLLFEDGTDLYFARQVVNERLQSVELPTGVARPELGPAATGLGEVVHYVLRGESHTLEELTTLHDWEIRPRLRSLRGVAEVNTWGGERRQYQVNLIPERLVKFGLTWDEVTQALRDNNVNAAGGNLDQAGEVHLVRGIGRVSSAEEIGMIVIRTIDGVPVRVRDVARVEVGNELRRGATTANGKGEVVLGLVFMLIGENSAEVTRRVAEEIERIRPTLPAGVVLEPLYLRTDLVDHVIATVRNNLFEAGILVVAVLFIFLGDLRAGLIVALAIPLSMLFAAGSMLRFGIAGSLMSLGAIDFGLIVDSSVIMVENSVRRLAGASPGRSNLDIVREAALEVRKPTMFGELIIILVYLPILTLEGVEGRLFRPMALTVVFALVGSMVLSLTLMPVLASLLLSRRSSHEGDNALMRLLKWLYRPVLRLAVAERGAVIALGVLGLAFGGWLVRNLGAEFVPRLSEEAITVNAIRLAGVSLDESVRYGGRIETLLREKFPDEIRDVWSRTGTAQIATDPMGLELTDIYMTLQPRSAWKQAHDQESLERRIGAVIEQLPGMRSVMTQPIELRMNEMVAGVRSDVGIKIFGDDLATLRDLGAKVQDVIGKLPGAADVAVEQITGQPMLEVRIDPTAIARFGISTAHALEVIEAFGGAKVGEVFQGQRRFDLVVRLADEARVDIETVARIQLLAASGERVPLERVATIRQTEGPSTISREWQRRRIVVQANVRERDLAGFVSAAKAAIEREVPMPAGYFVRFGGQFEHFERAFQRLMVVVPLALALIVTLLYVTYGCAADVIRIFLTLPLAAIGGLTALYLREMPFSISAGVGLVALLGISVVGDMVFVSYFRSLIAGGMELLEAIEETALTRLRPVLMTGLVASVGFVPMALSSGVGAEVQRPLATVVIGGVLTSIFCTLILLPAMYALAAPAVGRVGRGDRTGGIVRAVDAVAEAGAGGAR